MYFPFRTKPSDSEPTRNDKTAGGEERKDASLPGDEILAEILGDLSSESSTISPPLKKRGALPDWMRDPHEIAAEQDKISRELRAKKEEFRCAANKEWDGASDTENTGKIWEEAFELPQQGRVICFDLETSGFSHEDSIIEIGAVELIDGYRTGVLFQSYAKPRVPIHPMAQAAHQISEATLQQAPPVEFCVASFLDWVGESPLVSHNASFDMRMLTQELEKLGLREKFSRHLVFCTLKYWRKKFPQRAGTLDDMSAMFGVSRVVRRSVHGALVDAEILACCYTHLLRLPNR